jgi:hypothetical protein
VANTIIGFNLATFKAKIESRGVQRNNKFIMRFNAPQALIDEIGFSGEATSFQEVNRDLEFWCDGASIPAIMMTMRQIFRYGYGAIEKKPVSPLFTDITFSVLNDSKNSQNLRFFQQWMVFINNFDFRDPMSDDSPVFELRYKKEYAVDINLFLFNEAGTPVYAITMREAFPVNVNEMPVNWADNANPQRIPVTFSFHDWYDVGVFQRSTANT